MWRGHVVFQSFHPRVDKGYKMVDKTCHATLTNFLPLAFGSFVSCGFPLIVPRPIFCAWNSRNVPSSHFSFRWATRGVLLVYCRTFSRFLQLVPLFLPARGRTRFVVRSSWGVFWPHSSPFFLVQLFASLFNMFFSSNDFVYPRLLRKFRGK